MTVSSANWKSSWVGAAPNPKRWAWVGVWVLHLAAAITLIPLSGAYLEKYPRFAALLLGGKLGAEAAAAPSPLYLLLNCALSPGSLRVFQLLASALLIRSLYLVGHRLGGTVLAVLSSVLLAGTQQFFVYEAVLEPDFLWAVTLFSGLEILWAARAKHSAKVGAALLGLSVALRPLVLPIVLLSWVGVHLIRRREQKTFADWQVAIGICAVFALIPMLAVQVRSGAGLGAVMSGGAVYFEGNRPEATGDGAVSPRVLRAYEAQVSAAQPIPDYGHILYMRFAQAALGRLVSPADTQAYWRGLAGAYFWEHPGAYLKLQLKKLAFTLSGSETAELRQARQLEQGWRSHALPWRMNWVFTAGLVGAGVFAALGGGFFVAVWAGLALSIAAFSPTDRYLILLLPFAALFAGALPWGIVSQRRAVFAGALVALAFTRNDVVTQMGRFAERLSAASRLWVQIDQSVSSKNLERATSLLASANADFPYGEWVVDFRYLPYESADLAGHSIREATERWGIGSAIDRIMLVDLLERAGKCQDVLTMVGQMGSVPFKPTYRDWVFDPHLAAARCALRAGDRAGALEWVRRSLADLPGASGALAMGYALASASPEGAKSAQAFKRELMALHDAVSAHYALAHALRVAGAFAEAHAELKAAEVLGPLYLFEYERAVLYANEGRWPETVRSLNRAIDLMGSRNYPVQPLAAGIEKLGREKPNDPEVAMARVRVLSRIGRVQEALMLATLWTEKPGPRAPEIFFRMRDALRQVAPPLSAPVQALSVPVAPKAKAPIKKPSGAKPGPRSRGRR